MYTPRFSPDLTPPNQLSPNTKKNCLSPGISGKTLLASEALYQGQRYISDRFIGVRHGYQYPMKDALLPNRRGCMLLLIYRSFVLCCGSLLLTNIQKVVCDVIYGVCFYGIQHVFHLNICIMLAIIHAIQYTYPYAPKSHVETGSYSC